MAASFARRVECGTRQELGQSNSPWIRGRKQLRFSTIPPNHSHPLHPAQTLSAADAVFQHVIDGAALDYDGKRRWAWLPQHSSRPHGWYHKSPLRAQSCQVRVSARSIPSFSRSQRLTHCFPPLAAASSPQATTSSSAFSPKTTRPTWPPSSLKTPQDPSPGSTQARTIWSSPQKTALFACIVTTRAPQHQATNRSTPPLPTSLPSSHATASPLAALRLNAPYLQARRLA